MDSKHDASAASDDTRVEQTERMTDVTVISRRDGLRGRCRPSVGRVIVVNENRIAIGVVSAGVSPIERAATNDRGEHRSQPAAYETLTDAS